MSDPYEEIIKKALKKARRPLSTRKIATRTKMDWATAQKRLEKMEHEQIVNLKKLSSQNSWSLFPKNKKKK